MFFDFGSLGAGGFGPFGALENPILDGGDGGRVKGLGPHGHTGLVGGAGNALEDGAVFRFTGDEAGVAALAADEGERFGVETESA